MLRIKSLFASPLVVFTLRFENILFMHTTNPKQHSSKIFMKTGFEISNIFFSGLYNTNSQISLCKFSLTFTRFKYFHENLITTGMIEPMVNKYTFCLFRINNAVILYRISANSPLLSSPR